MSGTFDPNLLRQLASGVDTITRTLPDGYLELLRIVKFSPTNSIEPGEGLATLADIATSFRDSVPETIKKSVAQSWSKSNNLLTPTQPGVTSLSEEYTRPKTEAEYTYEESTMWARFMGGIGSGPNPITRQTAVDALGDLNTGIQHDLSNIREYPPGDGEDRDVFSRAKGILGGTPYIIGRLVLPDMTSIEAHQAYSIDSDQFPDAVDEAIRRAEVSVFETREA
ncbi:MAG: hypothetical protein ABI220_02205 [Candidatus Saccharimonadales bacterium]